MPKCPWTPRTAGSLPPGRVEAPPCRFQATTVAAPRAAVNRPRPHWGPTGLGGITIEDVIADDVGEQQPLAPGRLYRLVVEVERALGPVRVFATQHLGRRLFGHLPADLVGSTVAAAVAEPGELAVPDADPGAVVDDVAHGLGKTRIVQAIKDDVRDRPLAGRDLVAGLEIDGLGHAFEVGRRQMHDLG